MGLLSIIGVDSLFSTRVFALLCYAWLAYTVLSWAYRTIYIFYFHPLRNFPGPKLWLIFPFTRQLESVLGTRDWTIVHSHEKYGEVVRGGPDILTFTHPDAWKDIYGHGHAELPKAGMGGGSGPQNIINADAKTHFRYRRAMLPAFSDRALGEQEDLIKVYIDLLMKRLGEVADRKDSDNATDMARFYNFTTFDLIGDLAFGENLGGLEHGGSNAWLDLIGKSLKLLPTIAFLQQNVPGIPILLRLVQGASNKHNDMVKELTQKRIRNAEYGHRGDFMDQIMRSRGKEQELTDDELAVNANILMVAGTETTSTLLAGVTYLLLANPEKLARVRDEVRSAFDRKEDITFAAASSKLPYTLACLNEALRVYPPVPILMPRETPKGQMTPIAGHMIPGGMKVGVPHLAAYHSPLNFHAPTTFIPERWLPESTSDPSSPFYHDRRDVHKPFSFGPRDCIGRNLAFHEMRLILARLMWEFDLERQEESRGWAVGESQKIRVFWDKPRLMVGLKRREEW